jgi:ABC-type transport system substrate-binding protein
MSIRPRQLALLVSLAAAVVSAGWLSARWSAGQETPAKEQPAKEAPKEAAKASAAEEDENLPFYRRQPHEELHLRDGKTKDGKEKVAIVKIRPLQLENDELPKSIIAEIQVRLLDRDQIYTLQRGKILRWLRFRDLILREAERLVEAGKTDPKKFDEAFYYYQHLRANYQDKLATLNASTARFHVEEARSYLPAGRHAQALALLNLAFELHPETPGLADVMAETIQKLFDGYLAQQKFASARALLTGFQQKFPQHPSAATWQGQLSTEAQKLFDQAKAHYEAQRLHEAREMALRSVSIWPLDDARKLLDEAQRRSPRIVVGVTEPAVRLDPQRLDDWAARRSGRLPHRMLLEFTGHGSLGGQYRCPLGPDPRHEALGRQLVLELNPKIAWSDGQGMLTAADVCRHLMAMADQGDQAAYRDDWAELFVAARVRNDVEVVIDLRRSHVHPDGLLQTVVLPWYQRAKQAVPATLGPFVVQQSAAGEVRYRANPRYFAAGAAQPKEIVERHFSSGRAAVTALRNGEIAALDRVNPWDVDRLQAVSYLVTRPYAVPTVHCLIPHPDHKLLARRTFRRCLESAIHRQKILDELLKGSRQPGNQLISGPFPAGIDKNDPRGYAYDYSVPPRPYDRALAVTLLNLAVAQENVARKKREEAPLEAVPPLVLLHPPHDVARVACKEIKTQLEKLGLTINLQEQLSAAGASSEPYDLRYAELALWEPVIDAHRVLGPGGIVGRTSSYMSLALRDLAQAEDWERVLPKLQYIHRLAHEELPLIPLWQLADYFAHHRDLKGVGENCVSLYQNIEEWQTPPAILNTAPEATAAAKPASKK